MLTFEEFCHEIRDNIADYIGMFYDIENVDIQEVTKNNGVLCTGLVVKRTDANISPNIYLEGYYQKYLNGMEMEKVLTEIMKDYHMASMRIKESDKEILSYIQNSDYYYQNAFVRVVNYERNKDIAETCPVRKELDLMATLRLRINMSEDGLASSQITTKDILRLDLDVNKLWNCAKENSRNFFPVQTATLYDMVTQMMPEEDILPMPGGEAYVLTNSVGMNGAGAIMYAKESINEVAQELGGNVMILPSSIHELILMKEESMDMAKSLQQMVMEINAAVVDDMDILSNSVYKFDRDTKEITIAAKDPMIKEKTKDRELGE